MAKEATKEDRPSFKKQKTFFDEIEQNLIKDQDIKFLSLNLLVTNFPTELVKIFVELVNWKNKKKKLLLLCYMLLNYISTQTIFVMYYGLM